MDTNRARLCLDTGVRGASLILSIDHGGRERTGRMGEREEAVSYRVDAFLPGEDVDSRGAAAVISSGVLRRNSLMSGVNFLMNSL